MIISKIADPDDFIEIYRFRYITTYEEFGLSHKSACHCAKIVRDALDDGHSRIFASHDANELIGTIRASDSRSSNLTDFAKHFNVPEFDQAKGFGVISAFSIATGFRTFRHARALLSTAIRDLRDSSIDIVYMDTPVPLVATHCRVGATPFGGNARRHPAYGVPTLLYRLDKAALGEALGGPLLPVRFPPANVVCLTQHPVAKRRRAA